MDAIEALDERLPAEPYVVDPRPPRPPAPPLVTRRSLRAKRKQAQTPVQAAVGAAVEVVVVLAMALVLSLVIKTYLVQAFYIPSQSMQNTLLIGDRVLVSKLTPGPFQLNRGDVIVFRDPGNWLNAPPKPDDGPVRGGVRAALTLIGLLPEDSGEHLIKRVIGLPGDTVVCCDAAGRLQVNGRSIDETPYLKPGNVPSTLKFTARVKPGNLWVMGDNRSESSDSRYHPTVNDGQVPVDNVVGKAFVVVWPFARISGITNPGVFATVPASPGPR
jgi:signal peptidase I